MNLNAQQRLALEHGLAIQRAVAAEARAALLEEELPRLRAELEELQKQLSARKPAPAVRRPRKTSPLDGDVAST